MVKVDIGCGKQKKEGFIGVDIIPFEGVDVVMDAGKDKWPWEDGSVDEVYCSHVVEHFTAEQRVHFVNELHRVLKTKGTALIITPHWASQRAYGDLTHQWPPVSEMWFFYLNKEWRESQAPHNQMYTCDFDTTWGYGVDPAIQSRNQEYQQYAAQWFKNALTDTIATLTKRG
jgi:ubiquinone/menaquinone biosynthesis C-methylase UbiE